MNDLQKLDYEYVNYFLIQWLQRWLMHLRELRGSLTFLHTEGGLIARYTNVEPELDPDKYGYQKFIRIHPQTKG